MCGVVADIGCTGVGVGVSALHGGVGDVTGVGGVSVSGTIGGDVGDVVGVDYDGGVAAWVVHVGGYGTYCVVCDVMCVVVVWVGVAGGVIVVVGGGVGGGWWCWCCWCPCCCHL